MTQRLTGRKQVTGEDVRRGLETLDLTDARWTELGLAGFAGPFRLTCQDHNGHRPAFVQRWDGAKWAKVSDLIPPLTERLTPLLTEAAKDYVEKSPGWPRRTETCDAS